MFNRDRFTSLDEFTNWARSLPEDGTFCYMSNSSCVFASWAKACGAIKPSAGGWKLFDRAVSRQDAIAHFAATRWQELLNNRMVHPDTECTITRPWLLATLVDIEATLHATKESDNEPA